ncbi:hypothetical protein UJ101_01679 [Flavobacteriaceae bacterium UJ101]|nr:hypothetical protein UJ101_01679 [Flavobacteriaceae bacterium UJ101]
MKKHINFIIIFLLFAVSIGSAQNNYQDISKALDVCKTSVLTFPSPSGYGVIDDLKEDSAKGCLSTGEQNSIWLKVTIAQSGQFGFNIITPSQRDYDFAVYESINVNNPLNTPPIRCSFAKTDGRSTGIGDSSQFGFEDWISATNGKIYYILINSTQTAASNDQIQFELTGTAEYNCDDTASPILPTWEDTSICGKDFIELNAQPTNLSSSVQVFYEWTKDGVSLDYNNPTLNVTEVGTYSVSVTANLLPPIEQTAIITGNPSDPPPTLELDGHDTDVFFCETDNTPTLKVTSNSNDIKWFIVHKGILYDTGITGKEYKTSSTGVFIVRAYNDSKCDSKSITITVQNYPKVSISGETKYPICSGQTPSLTVSTNGKTVEWYDSTNTLRHTGLSWSNVPLGEYYAIAKGISGESCDSAPFNINVIEDATPTGLSAEDVFYCGIQNLQLKIDFKDGIGEQEAIVTWYSQETGGVIKSRGNPFVPKEPSGIYWAEVTSNAYCTQPTGRIRVEFRPSGDTPTLKPESDFYGFCQNQTEEIITVISNASSDNVLWYLDKNGTLPLLDSTGTQVKGKQISVTSSGNYWVQAIGTNDCKSSLVKISVLNYKAPQLKDPPTEIFSCGNTDVETLTLYATDNTVDMSDPNSVEWYSNSDLASQNLIGKGNNFILPQEYIGETVYVQLINRIGCFSITYPMSVVYKDPTTITASTDLEQFYCQDVTPNPLGAKTNDDNYEIIWYNSDNIERGRTKNGETINPHPDDYASNDVTIYYAEAINPLSGCTSERLEFTFTKITPPIISSDISELNYCKDSEYEELNITISNGDPQFIKWFDSTDTEVGTGTKLVIIDLKNGIDLGEGEFYATASSDGKNCASNTIFIQVNELDLSDTAITTPNTILFEGDTLEFSTTNPTDIETYLWTGPNDFSSDLANPIIENVTLDHTGQYNVLMSNKCESKTNSIDILVLENVETALGENIVFCKNDTGTIDPVTKDLSNKYPQDYIFQWYGPNGFSSNEKTITISEVGRYVLTVTSPEGNSSTGSLAVLFSTLDLQNENIKTCYNQTLLQPIGGTQPYQYALDNGPWQSSPIFTNITQGFHTYKVQDANGCVIETSGEYYTPFVLRKAFTPNGDGYNDTWDLSALQGCTNLDVKIFDRYGRYLYQIKTNNLKWDGNINGKPLPNGTYWYVMEFNDGATPILKGHITIRRTKD